jgi:hypothetical protein
MNSHATITMIPVASTTEQIISAARAHPHQTHEFQLGLALQEHISHAASYLAPPQIRETNTRASKDSPNQFIRVHTPLLTNDKSDPTVDTSTRTQQEPCGRTVVTTVTIITPQRDSNINLARDTSRPPTIQYNTTTNTPEPLTPRSQTSELLSINTQTEPLPPTETRRQIPTYANIPSAVPTRRITPTLSRTLAIDPASTKFYKNRSLRKHTPVIQPEFEHWLTGRQFQPLLYKIKQANKNLPKGAPRYYVNQMQQYGRTRTWMQGVPGAWREEHITTRGVPLPRDNPCAISMYTLAWTTKDLNTEEHTSSNSSSPNTNLTTPAPRN